MIEAFAYARPEIPEGLMHEMFDVRKKEGDYDSENGGQWVPGTEERIPFKGVILPVTSKDLCGRKSEHTVCTIKRCIPMDTAWQ